MPIEKRLHAIWIGPKPRPANLMATWPTLNPSWSYTLWSNEKEKAPGVPWRMQRQINAMTELNGKADLMRYELLFDHGGVCVDADSEALRPLDERFVEPEAWACWESETHIPGMIATGYIGAHAGAPILHHVLGLIERRSAYNLGLWAMDPAWRTLGPLIFTEVAKDHPELKIFPAGYMLPEHYSGVAPAPCDEAPFAAQYWGSTVHSKHFGYRGLT